MTRALIAFGFSALVLCAPGQAQEVDPLAAIRDDLTRLRFEQAIAAVGRLLDGADVPADVRAEALILRSEAHVAVGKLSAAERDWGDVLRLRPGFVPDPARISSKAMARFEALRKRSIGRVRFVVDPPDAAVTVDATAVELREEGVPLSAGEHVVRAERSGFDPAEQTFLVEADRQGELRIQLVPNARSVIVLTDQPGVQVRVDGNDVGHTALPDGPGSARLLLENLPLGEHTFELEKPCFRTELRREFLTVDLMDRSPQRIGPVELVPARATVALRAGPVGSTVRVDGDVLGRLPMALIDVCAGEREIEIRGEDRTLWLARVQVESDANLPLDVVPRPNLTRVGQRTGIEPEDAWVGFYNLRTVDRVSEIPKDTDVAVERDASGRLLLHGPLIGQTIEVDSVEGPTVSPAWTTSLWGIGAVDSRLGGTAMVAEVGAAAAAAGLRPGDRVLEVGGGAIREAAQLDRILAVASDRAPLEVVWVSPDGTRSTGRLTARRSMLLAAAPDDPEASIWRAGWAAAGAAGDGDEVAAARANLAILLAAHGRYEQALAAWERVGLSERPGIGAGTRAYYVGSVLQALGRDEAAIAAFRTAAASAATTFHDEGPALAPAARDRLADLGVR